MLCIRLWFMLMMLINWAEADVLHNKHIEAFVR